MKFDPFTGSIEITPNLTLKRYLKSNEILNSDKTLEWLPFGYIENGIVRQWKTVLEVQSNDKQYSEISLIIMCNKDTSEIQYWDIVPWDMIGDWNATTPEETRKLKKKYVRNVANWFNDEFDIRLPIKGEWGEINAFYDPHNLSSSVTCIYKEYRNP